MKDRLASLLFRGHLRYFVLKTINKKKMYGYAIINTCYEATNKEWKPSFGSIYPMLKKLEKEGLIESSVEKHGNRIVKVYSITKKGKERLKILEKRRAVLENLLKHEGKIKEKILNSLEKIGATKELAALRNAFLKVAKKISKNELSEEKCEKLKETILRFAKEIEHATK